MYCPKLKKNKYCKLKKRAMLPGVFCIPVPCIALQGKECAYQKEYIETLRKLHQEDIRRRKRERKRVEIELEEEKQRILRNLHSCY